MRFEISPDSLEIIQKYVSDFCEKNFAGTELKPKVFICTDEISSNIINYSGASYGEVLVSSEKDGNLSLTFIDDGVPFNPLEDSEIPDVKAGLEERKPGGLGIFMVKKMSESAEYSRKDNLNVLKITLHGEKS